MAVSLIVVFIYGSTIWYIFPIKENMSWEGHLSGFLVGILLAIKDTDLDSAEEVFGSVEAVKTVSDLFLPLSGEIIEFNELLESEPEKVNDDPYGEGWMIKVQISDSSEIENLMSAEDYKTMVGE